MISDDSPWPSVNALREDEIAPKGSAIADAFLASLDESPGYFQCRKCRWNWGIVAFKNEDLAPQIARWCEIVSEHLERHRTK